MMKRGFAAAVAVLLALSLPLGVVAAKGSNGAGHGPPGKIIVCHKATGAHPVTIMISSAAWKAHQAHGDTLGQCSGTPAKPAPTQGTCAFDAATSSYYGGPSSNPGSVVAGGPIHFSWTVVGGAVTVPGGYWTELYPLSAPLVYDNRISAGSVSGVAAVSLTFTRSGLSGTALSFVGSLTSTTAGASTLTGTMTSSTPELPGTHYYSATGQVTCTG